MFQWGADDFDLERLDHFLASTLLSHWIRIQCNAFQHNFMQVIKQPATHFRKVSTDWDSSLEHEGKTLGIRDLRGTTIFGVSLISKLPFYQN